MSTTTFRKIAAVDAAPNHRRGGDLRVLLSPITCAATSGFMGTGTLEPGEYVAEHYHPYSEEFLYVVRGRLVVRIEGEPVELGPDEAIMVPIGARHRIENPSTKQAQVVFHLSPLAPRPDLGHVDCEELSGPGELPRVGGAAQ